MNQIMPVGKGILVAIESPNRDQVQRVQDVWSERLPDIPVLVIGPAQIVLSDGKPVLFEFTGDVTPTVVAEFQRWWEEVNRD